jgi:hypothetical protein
MQQSGRNLKTMDLPWRASGRGERGKASVTRSRLQSVCFKTALGMRCFSGWQGKRDVMFGYNTQPVTEGIHTELRA